MVFKSKHLVFSALATIALCGLALTAQRGVAQKSASLDRATSAGNQFNDTGLSGPSSKEKSDPLSVGLLLDSTFPFQPASVATLQAQDSLPDNPPESTPKFTLHGITNDKLQLIVSKTEIGRQINAFSAELVTTFEVVSLNDTSVKSLLKLQGDAAVLLGLSGAKANLLTAKNQSLKSQLLLKPSIEEAPPKDILKSFTPSALSGRVVYVQKVPLSGTGYNTKWGTFVTVRRFGSGTNAVQTFPAEANGYNVFSPQWSPDGNLLLFKVGSQGDSTSTYFIHLWSLQQGQVKQGPKERISYLKPRWSPDSARIAYIVGGDISGNNGFLATTPTSLHVYDVATGQSRKLVTQVSNSELSLAQFQWQNANSLLYAGYGPSEEQAAKSEDSTAKPEEIRSAIYEIAATGGTPKLVIENALRPMPSPDERWIAFFGWPDAADAEAEQEANPQSKHFGPRLFFWDRQKQRRFLVQPNIFQNNVQMMWTPDSRKLVLLQSSYNSQAAQGTARISTIAVE